MRAYPRPLDLRRIRVYPLAERESLSSIATLPVDPDQPPPAGTARSRKAVSLCARKVLAARRRGASVILMYGAHLVKNGAMRITNRLIQQGWLTHLATN